jgi:two-component system chemotaxis response regulator CheY
MAKTILTIDDSKTMRDMVGFALKQAGYDVLEAANADDAMRVLQTRQPDCIISGLNSGEVEFIRGVRAMNAMKTLPILVLGAEANDLKRQAGRSAGANGWLPKPFVPSKLVDTVGKVCSWKQA